MKRIEKQAKSIHITKKDHKNKKRIPNLKFSTPKQIDNNNYFTLFQNKQGKI